MQPPFHDGHVKQPGEAALGVAPCRLAELAEDPVLRLGPERPRHVQQSFPFPVSRMALTRPSGFGTRSIMRSRSRRLSRPMRAILPPAWMYRS